MQTEIDEDLRAVAVSALKSERRRAVEDDEGNRGTPRRLDVSAALVLVTWV